MSKVGLFLICTIILPINGQQKSAPPQTSTKASQAKQKIVPPSPQTAPNTVINQQAPQIQENRPKEQAQSYFSRLFAPENLPNIALVIVGILGIIVAVFTLIKIERQTVAIEQQTKLQTVQWVALKNWRGEILQPYMLSVKVDIVNETNFPLTLEGTDFRVGTVTSAGTENVTVVPRAGHSIGFIHRMLEEEYTAYLTNRTAFGIRGAIRFSGISGKKVQPFGGLIAASVSFPDSIIFESRSEYEQSAKEHYGDIEPPN